MSSFAGEYGFGLFAGGRRDSQGWIGFVGLAVPRFDPPFTPRRRGRLAAGAPGLGQGYASEAARDALRRGFDSAGAGRDRRVHGGGERAQAGVMEKLGMAPRARGRLRPPDESRQGSRSGPTWSTGTARPAVRP